MAMVARDCRGKVVFLATKNIKANLADLVKLNALIWVSSIDEKYVLEMVEWKNNA